MVPTVRVHGDERVELLFSPRDEQGRSRIARAWLADLGAAADVEPEPVLDLGPLGAFDDSGVNPSCLVRGGDHWFLYYIGWTRGVSVRFQTAIGCAVSDDGGRSFERVSAGPVIGRDLENPYFSTSPWVIREDGRWRMWYASGVGWELVGDRPEPRYHIRYAESADGLRWDCSGPVCIDFREPSEHAIARPSVIRDGDRYRMWFSHRGRRYRIGYAESPDGLSWDRSATGPTLASSGGSGWESEMVEYPFVFDYRGERHLLYNGDGFGRTGVGHALYEDG
jgi:hypothetical protein